MSKYLKSYSLINRSYTAPEKSNDTLADTSVNTSAKNVGGSPESTNQVRIEGYTQNDLSLFDQLTQQHQQATPIRASNQTASTKQQAYTTQDIDNFNDLMKTIQPTSTT